MGSRERNGMGEDVRRRIPGPGPITRLPPRHARWPPSPGHGQVGLRRVADRALASDQPYQPTTSAITSVLHAALTMATLPLAPTRNTTRLGMVCPARKFKSDVVGRAAPSWNSVS